ncbi:MAG: lysine biosynthesis protein LysX [Zestosphaera tikiterensis]|uniref:Lysine biosynthesis protein LysX n=1 Tax=Zestosphaera tikiterensis TaxID=1973259 RepID=A0A2R7Y4R3_9CREN|nr:MAG: lysine biosynthesis protein LysX [Zestosphaera tikiterensis]
MSKVGISYEVLRWEEKVLIEAVRKVGLEVVPLHLHNVKLFTDPSKRELEEGLGGVELILQRAISHAIALNSTLVFESMGVRVVNNSTSLAVATNKLWTLKKLVESGIRVPNTAVAFSDEASFKCAELLKYPVVVKPIDGSWGRLIALARDEEELRAVLEHRSYIPSPTMKVYMIQEFVKKPGRDVRVLVVGDEVVAAIYRVSNHWITNAARGGNALPAKVDEEMKEIALKVAEVVNGKVLGIDIFEDPERGYLVNEVNAVPEFKNAAAATGIAIHLKIAEYLKSQVRE